MIILTPRERSYNEIGLIALRHNLTRQDILGRSHRAEVVRARNHCYAHFRTKGMSYPEIGRLMDRNHATVIHGIKRHLEDIKKWPRENLPHDAGYSEGLVA